MLSAIKQIYVPHKTRTIPFPPAILSVFVFVQFLAFLKIVHTNNAYVTMDKTQKKENVLGKRTNQIWWSTLISMIWYDIMMRYYL